MYDVHTHFVPAPMLNWLRDNAARVGASWEERVPGQAPFLTVNQKWSFEFKPAFHDMRLYLGEQAAAGVRQSLISPIPQLFLYDSEASLTVEAARVYNDSLADWASSHSDRLSVLATVPLNAGGAAADVLESALSAGHLGAIVGPGLGGALLSAPDFRAFWEVANAHRAIVFVHPLLNEDPRIQKNRMPNLIGVPWETTLTALDLILSGTLDRYPDARVLLAHGGGFLPYQIGRYERGYDAWPALRRNLQATPTEYLQRLYYDSVLWNREALSFLTSLVGVERVMPGSDYPFDLSVWPPVLASVDHVAEFLGKRDALC